MRNLRKDIGQTRGAWSSLGRTLVMSLLFFIAAIPGFLSAQSMCPWYERDTLAWMDGSTNSLQGWELVDPTDGGKWQMDQGPLAGMLNPGEGEWLYVSEQDQNNIGKAILLSPTWTNARQMSDLFLSFSLVLETYLGNGRCYAEVLSQGEWVRIFELAEDYYGDVEIQLGEFAGSPVQLRFVFDDEGEWSWGMGIDNILVSGRPGICGDGICEAGESCPGDCPEPDTAPGWVEVGKDLLGTQVSYTHFARGEPCDDCSEPVELGFGFEFYGSSYATVFINANGNLTFSAPHFEFTPEAFCQTGPEMIAPFFGDVDLERGGNIWYYLDPEKHYLIVTWEKVGYYGCLGAECEQLNSFQAILTDGSIPDINGLPMVQGANVLFSYGEMAWTTGTSSGGIRGFGGSPATVGINKGDGKACHDFGTFNRPGRAYYGNTLDLTCPPNEVDFLEGRSLTLNADIGQMIVPDFGLKLSAEAKKEGDVLSWQTERPFDWDFFIIEGGKDTLSLQELGMLYSDEYRQLSAGTFSFEVNQANVDAYYRVTGITTTGLWRHSNWVNMAAASDKISFDIVSIGPNPMSGPITAKIQAFEAGQLQWQVADMGGKVLKQGSWNTQAGTMEEQISLPSLPAGTYVFSVRGNDTVRYRYIVKL